MKPTYAARRFVIIAIAFLAFTKLWAQPIVFTSHLTGTQQNPMVTTPADGIIDAELFGDTLKLIGDFYDLTSNYVGGAAIHIGYAGQNGPVLFPIAVDLFTAFEGDISPDANTFILNPNQLALLNNRQLYINIPSRLQAEGEIRGQIVPRQGVLYQSILLGSQEVPAVNTEAFGNLIIESVGTQLIVSGSFDNLSDTVATDLAGGAHIHFGIPGRTGSVAIPLNLNLAADRKGATLLPAQNTFTLSIDQRIAFANDSLYVNIHSGAFRGGEIRGQIAQVTNTVFLANLTGMQEIPAVNVESYGQLYIKYTNGGLLEILGSFNELSTDLAEDIMGGVHVHVATAGQSGPIELLLNPALSADKRNAVFHFAENSFDIPDRIDELFDRELYVNIHSERHQAGELRGQFLPLAKTYLGADLSGFNEVESTYTFGRGNFQFELTDDQLIVSGGFSGMISDYDANIAGGCHLHYGNAFQNGPIALRLNPRVNPDLRSGTFPTDENQFTISAGFRDSLINGLIYVNIHSQRYPTGELRSQVLRTDNEFPDGFVFLTSPFWGDTILLDDDTNLDFNVASQNVPDPDSNLVVYNYQLSLTQDFGQVFYSKKVLDAEPAQFVASEIYQAAIDTGIQWLTPTLVFQRLSISDGAVSIFGDRIPFTLSLKPNVPTNGGGLSLQSGAIDTTICIDGGTNPFVVLPDGAAVGTNFNFIITSIDGTILAVDADSLTVDLNTYGVGEYQLFYLASHADLEGLTAGNNVADLTGSFNFSNAVSVSLVVPNAGSIGLQNGATAITLTAGMGQINPVHTTSSATVPYYYILTDSLGTILQFFDASTTSMIDFSSFAPADYFVWGWSSFNTPLPVIGEELASLSNENCENITSQSITVTIEADTSSSINQQLEGLAKVSIFPNPVVNQLVVEVSAQHAIDAIVSLYTISGQQLSSKIASGPQSKVVFNMDQLASGTYQVVVTASGKTVSNVVVKP